MAWNTLISLGAFTPRGPQLATAVGFSAETLHGIRVDLVLALLFFVSVPTWIIIEGEFCHGRYIAESEERKVVETFVPMMTGDREHLAIRIARMVHETCGRTVFLAVDDVYFVVVNEEVQ